jgi:hypothetical protein
MSREKLTPAQRAAVLNAELESMGLFNRRYSPPISPMAAAGFGGLDGRVLAFSPQAKAAIKRWILTDRFDRKDSVTPPG